MKVEVSDLGNAPDMHKSYLNHTNNSNVLNRYMGCQIGTGWDARSDFFSIVIKGFFGVLDALSSATET